MDRLEEGWLYNEVVDMFLLRDFDFMEDTDLGRTRRDAGRRLR